MLAVRHRPRSPLPLLGAPLLTRTRAGGVGGPAREIARFAEVHVTGINNNQYQVTRANEHTRRLGMESMCSFVKGDFMHSTLRRWLAGASLARSLVSPRARVQQCRSRTTRSTPCTRSRPRRTLPTRSSATPRSSACSSPEACSAATSGASPRTTTPRTPATAPSRRASRRATACPTLPRASRCSRPSAPPASRCSRSVTSRTTRSAPTSLGTSRWCRATRWAPTLSTPSSAASC